VDRSDPTGVRDRVAVVTGASRGLGREFAIGLAKAGARLVISCRHGTALEDTAEKISALGRDPLVVEADITDEGQVQRLVDLSIEKFGRIDILVNNAATERINKSPEETSLSEWNFVIQTNVTGPFICARAVVPVMQQQRGGKIINLSSKSGFTVGRYFHGGSYDVSKAAVAMLTKVLAVEWSRYNVHVIGVAPGYYDTEPNQRFFISNPDMYRKVIDLVPLGRLGNLAQLGDLVVCLASDVSNYMSGTTVLIDGGYNVW